MDNIYFYSWLILFFTVFLGLWFTRTYWAPHILPSSLYSHLPASFTEDVEAGLSSDSFNLAGNITDPQDSRAGLDANSKREILKIMKGKRMSFDDARTEFLRRKMQKNGIGADGRPLDPRAVFFS